MIRDSLPYVPTGHWHGELALGYACLNGRTLPVHRWHRGSLRIQKHSHPEGDALCHQLISIPPQGIAGSERQSLHLWLAGGCRVLATTDKATLWHDGRGDSASLHLVIELSRDSHLEWLPRENTLLPGADAVIDKRFELEAGATLLASDVISLGSERERFSHGCWRQHYMIQREGRPAWRENRVMSSGSWELDAPTGLGGRSVCATLLWVGPDLPAATIARCRAIGLLGDEECGQTEGIWLARHICDGIDEANTWVRALWHELRPHTGQRAACPPRAWQES
ncbi:urease accessory protein UreD [Paludibacterium yongneupense]|uniref:urease accessory protein UreD n=1 Tax=Paludibacterium yongneupense TaxID=400061 RepID=UPI00041346BB|nr:urease accessory protein UreD [Paludibacterium yongneupense]